MRLLFQIFTLLLIITIKVSAQDLDSTIIENPSRLEIILTEAGAGTLVGAAAIFPTALALSLIYHPNDFGSGFYLATVSIYLGFTIGSSYAIYSIDSDNNKNASFYKTFSGGLIGLGISYLILRNETKLEGMPAIMSVVSPLVCSLISTNIFKFEYIKENVDISYFPEINRNNLVHTLNFKIKI